MKLTTIPFDKYFQEYTQKLATQTKVTEQQLNQLRKQKQLKILRIVDPSVTIDEVDIEHYSLTANDLDKIRSMVREDVHAVFCKEYDIPQHITNIAHQLLMHFGNWVPVKVGDLYSGEATVRKNATTDFEKGICMFATSSKVGMFSGAPRTVVQYKSPIGPLVPIVLAGFKCAQNVKYSQWDRNSLEYIVDKDLLAAMLCDPKPLSTEEALLYRSMATTDGKNKSYAPNSCAKLNRLGETTLGDLPKLARYMSIQTWCAHPANRTEYMILDPKDWDNMPAPLVSESVLLPTNRGGLW